MQDDLIARIEAAEGPSLALDRDIALSVLPSAKAINGNDAWVSVWDGNGRTQLTVRRYTASLDAAMTLVPEGWDHMEVYRPDHQTLGWTVHLMPNANLGRETWEGFAQSFPLALCAAALRARAAMGGGDD